MPAAAAAAAATTNPAAPAKTALRVCADPDNLPYSSEDGSGFENRIARVIADELELPLQYTWLPDRRGFVRKTLGAGLCDVIIGVPVGFGPVASTHPYYRSSYVFVQREPGEGSAPLASFDDARLASLRIGVQLIGNDLAASPPGYALARRGAVENVVGYTVYGDGPPAARMIDAVAKGELDAAVIWGPQAGYFATHAGVSMRVTRAPSPSDLASMPLAIPFEFSIAMGVRRSDLALLQRLDNAIARRQRDIDAILDEYNVPRVDSAALSER
jgi:mxaJ protein